MSLIIPFIRETGCLSSARLTGNCRNLLSSGVKPGT
ncbi:MAG: hypothetical protein AB1724_07195 [Thermodesulfobacteriota bacterium]